LKLEIIWTENVFSFLFVSSDLIHGLENTFSLGHIFNAILLEPEEVREHMYIPSLFPFPTYRSLCHKT